MGRKFCLGVGYDENGAEENYRMIKYEISVIMPKYVYRTGHRSDSKQATPLVQSD